VLERYKSNLVCKKLAGFYSENPSTLLMLPIVTDMKVRRISVVSIDGCLVHRHASM
jgi:hypothetical protein